VAAGRAHQSEAIPSDTPSGRGAHRSASREGAGESGAAAAGGHHRLVDSRQMRVDLLSAQSELLDLPVRTSLQSARRPRDVGAYPFFDLVRPTQNHPPVLPGAVPGGPVPQ
jgi:hypothetical protein